MTTALSMLGALCDCLLTSDLNRRLTCNMLRGGHPWLCDIVNAARLLLSCRHILNRHGSNGFPEFTALFAMMPSLTEIVSVACIVDRGWCETRRGCIGTSSGLLVYLTGTELLRNWALLSGVHFLHQSILRRISGFLRAWIGLVPIGREARPSTKSSRGILQTIPNGFGVDGGDGRGCGMGPAIDVAVVWWPSVIKASSTL